MNTSTRIHRSHDYSDDEHGLTVGERNSSLVAQYGTRYMPGTARKKVGGNPPSAYSPTQEEQDLGMRFAAQKGREALQKRAHIMYGDTGKVTINDVNGNPHEYPASLYGPLAVVEGCRGVFVVLRNIGRVIYVTYSMELAEEVVIRLILSGLDLWLNDCKKLADTLDQLDRLGHGFLSIRHIRVNLLATGSPPVTLGKHIAIGGEPAPAWHFYWNGGWTDAEVVAAAPTLVPCTTAPLGDVDLKKQVGLL